MTCTMEGNIVSMSGTTGIGRKQAKMRGSCVFAPGGRSFAEKLAVSVDGTTWIPTREIRLAKAT
jgi:hypothetical protein